MSGTDGQLISELGLGQVAEKFDLTSRVDATFLAELSAMKQAVEKVRVHACMHACVHLYVCMCAFIVYTI